MDQAMHAHWLKAERRLDFALAGLVACAMWMIGVPVAVVFTSLVWSQHVLVSWLLAIPVGVVFILPLVQGVLVARAIEERDRDEVERWKNVEPAPANPELVQERQRRVHVPLLLVSAIAHFSFIALALGAALHPRNDAELWYAAGYIAICAGVALGSVVLMLSGRVSTRVQSLLIACVSWPVPIGFGLCAAAFIVHPDKLVSSGAEGALTAVVIVIFGIMLTLCALMVGGAWVVLCHRALTGRGLTDGSDQRSQVILLVAQLAGAESRFDDDFDASEGLGELEPEFDAEDVQIVSDALRIDAFDVIVSIVLIAMCVAIYWLNFTGMAGGILHGVFGLGLLGTIAVLVRQIRSHLHVR